MENMERTIERIQKLMALAMSDPDTPEAKAAAAKAAELLAKYELDMADLNEENKNDILEETFKSYRKEDEHWEQMLLAVLRSTFDIHVVVDVAYRGKITYRMFGKKQDLVLCSYFFKMIRRLTIKRSETEYKTTHLRYSFRCGLINSIAMRFMEIKKTRQEHRTEMTTALAVQNRADVDRYIAEKFKNCRKHEIGKPKITTDAEYRAWKRGEEIGKNVPLNTPLEGEYEQARGIN